MQGILLISLVCALLGIVSFCAATRRIALLRRLMIARIVVVVFGLSAVAAPLMPVQPALAAPPTPPDTVRPLTCSVYRPDRVVHDKVDEEMQAGAHDIAIGD